MNARPDKFADLLAAMHRDAVAIARRHQVEWQMPNRMVDEAEVIRLVKQGLTQDAIADKLGCSTAGICTRISRLRKSGKLPPKSRDSRAGDAAILAGLKRGLTVRQVAEECGYHQTHIGRRRAEFRKAGLLPERAHRGAGRKRGRGEDIDMQRLLRLIQNRDASPVSIRSLAAIFDCNQSTIWRAMDRLKRAGHLPADLKLGQHHDD